MILFCPLFMRTQISMSVQEELMNVTRPATTPLGPIPVVVMQDTGWPQMGGTAQVCLLVCCDEVTYIS